MYYISHCNCPVILSCRPHLQIKQGNTCKVWTNGTFTGQFPFFWPKELFTWLTKIAPNGLHKFSLISCKEVHFSRKINENERERERMWDNKDNPRFIMNPTVSWRNNVVFVYLWFTFYRVKKRERDNDNSARFIMNPTVPWRRDGTRWCISPEQ